MKNYLKGFPNSTPRISEGAPKVSWHICSFSTISSFEFAEGLRKEHYIFSEVKKNDKLDRGHHVGNLTYLINGGKMIQKGMALTVIIVQYQIG